MGPFMYQILHSIRGHSYIKRLILLPITSCKVFYTESSPPPGFSSSSLINNSLLLVVLPFSCKLKLKLEKNNKNNNKKKKQEKKKKKQANKQTNKMDMWLQGIEVHVFSNIVIYSSMYLFLI